MQTEIYGRCHRTVTEISSGNVTQDDLFATTVIHSDNKSPILKTPDWDGSSYRAPMPYERWIITPALVPGTIAYSDDSYIYRMTGSDGGALIGRPEFSFQPGIDIALGELAITRALLKLKNQKFHLALAWKERDQVANLVADTAKRLALSFLLIRKGKFKEAAAHLGIRRNFRKLDTIDPYIVWLELRYGWGPLLSDVYGACEALADSGRKNRDLFLVTVKGVETRKIENRVTHQDNIGLRRLEKGRQGAFCRLDYIPGEDFFHVLSSLGVTNPLELAWQATYLTFVVDWMWSVGDWLNILDANLGFEFVGGSLSLLVKRHAIFTPGNFPVAPGYSVVEDTRHAYMREVHLIRQTYTSSPLPRPPELANNLNLKRMADALSLLMVAFGKKDVDIRRASRL